MVICRKIFCSTTDLLEKTELFLAGDSDVLAHKEIETSFDLTPDGGGYVYVGTVPNALSDIIRPVSLKRMRNSSS